MPIFNLQSISIIQLRGANNVLNTDHKVRLQLYCPPVRYRTKGNQLQVTSANSII